MSEELKAVLRKRIQDAVNKDDEAFEDPLRNHICSVVHEEYRAMIRTLIEEEINRSIEEAEIVKDRKFAVSMWRIIDAVGITVMMAIIAVLTAICVKMFV